MSRKRTKTISLVLSLLIVASMLISACGGDDSEPAAADAPAEAAAPAAEESEAKESESEEMMAEVDLSPSEYPEPQLIVGSREVQKLPLDQIIAYKALDSYSEPDWISDLVAEGALPPVEERLPLEPYVVLKSGMAEGIGVYGGVWRDFSACPTEGFNRGAGQSAGWFGIEAAAFASLLKSGPIYRRSDSLEPLPFLARSWEWSEDGYELTMNLLEGAKWSDGHPFTTEDILFTWEDMIVDSNVQSPKGVSA